MTTRRLPVRPDLDRLEQDAEVLLRAFRSGEPPAVAEFIEYLPSSTEPARASSGS